MPSAKVPINDPVWRRMANSWNAFWFTPRDPTVLGLIRITCGAITCYTLMLYSFALGDFLGPDGWVDQRTIDEIVHHQPRQVGTLSGHAINVPRAPRTEEERLYWDEYEKTFGVPPLPPYPKNLKEANDCARYHRMFSTDLRWYGLPPPRTEKELHDLLVYSEKWQRAMPPPYPQTEAEIEEIDRFIKQFNVDPRLNYSRGAPVFSVFMHIDHPVGVALTHGLFVLAAILFTLGLATRVTAFITWFAALNYIHRNTVILFGADTMMIILLLYLAIGPAGAALSLDRLVARWWKARGTGRWLAPAEPPEPAVAANLAIRLLQVHLCIIYLVAGLAKLLGPAWWNGTALWGTLANFEFAPMNWRIYNEFLRFLGSHQLLLEGFLTGGAYFTMAFEILYIFWIWRPSTRWLMLSAAILLHGFIGVLMGLSTFALIMLVMNAAFLRTGEVYWILGVFGLEPPGMQKASGGLSGA